MNFGSGFNPGKTSFKPGFQSNESTFHTGISVPTSKGYYKGDYDVIPDSDGRVLETKDKIMEKNVNIFPIPTYETSNESGGKTFYIGGNINYG